MCVLCAFLVHVFGALLLCCMMVYQHTQTATLLFIQKLFASIWIAPGRARCWLRFFKVLENVMGGVRHSRIVWNSHFYVHRPRSKARLPDEKTMWTRPNMLLPLPKQKHPPSFLLFMSPLSFVLFCHDLFSKHKFKFCVPFLAHRFAMGVVYILAYFVKNKPYFLEGLIRNC